MNSLNTQMGITEEKSKWRWEQVNEMYSLKYWGGKTEQQIGERLDKMKVMSKSRI